MKSKRANKKLFLLPIVSLGVTTLFYTNCQKQVEFEKSSKQTLLSQGPVTDLGKDPVEVPVGEPVREPVDDPEVIKTNCQMGNLKQAGIKVQFPNPNKTCAWNQGENLEPRNSFFQARIEQKVELSQIPSGAVICDMDLQFQRQSFVYDDHFLMTLDDHVLASSYDFGQVLPVSNSLLKYDWSFIKGLNWDTRKETVYCAGKDENLSSCSWPDTEVSGIIDLQYDSNILYRIMAAGSSGTHDLTFVTIGDNDNLDCEHSDIEFDLTVRYY